MTTHLTGESHSDKRKTPERFIEPMTGYIMLFLAIFIMLGAIALFIFGGINAERSHSGPSEGIAMIISAIVLVIAFSLILPGLFIANPNECRVIVLFCKYKGTVRNNGFFWVNPFTVKHRISMKIRNYDGEKLKVNDSNGNPIDISAVIVWRVRNTAEALFDVDDYMHFVQVQSESALRQLATHYPYDSQNDETVSLRANADEVGDKLKERLEERLIAAGIEVIDARLNHLAYAQEIAAAMLQRQQAEAIIAARQKIVEGAVGMVQMALAKLKEENILELDDERKAAMVSNLLVVLCSDHSTTPVINAGTLYS